MAEEVQVCPDCGDAIEDTEAFYNCNSCGNEFPASEGEGRGNTCPECHKWAARNGEVHEGCSSPIEDAETGYKCEECESVYDTEEEAEGCEKSDRGELVNDMGEEGEMQAKAEQEDLPRPYRVKPLSHGGKYLVEWNQDASRYGREFAPGLLIPTAYVLAARDEARGRKFLRFQRLTLSGPYKYTDKRGITSFTRVSWTWGSSSAEMDPSSLVVQRGIVDGYLLEFSETIKEIPARFVEMDMAQFVAWQREMEKEVLDGKRRVRH